MILYLLYIEVLNCRPLDSILSSPFLNILKSLTVNIMYICICINVITSCRNLKNGVSSYPLPSKSIALSDLGRRYGLYTSGFDYGKGEVLLGS